VPSKITPLRPVDEKELFDNPEWLFELKHDGFRALAYVDRAGCTDRALRLGWNLPDLNCRFPRRRHVATVQGENKCPGLAVVTGQGDHLVPSNFPQLYRGYRRAFRHQPAQIGADGGGFNIAAGIFGPAGRAARFASRGDVPNLDFFNIARRC
jgi:hypothetical protein